MSDINIGALSEAINDKMDRDLNNRSDDSGLRKLVESYVNGTEWYKVFDEIQSDGTVKQWCEQGGIYGSWTGNFTVTINFLKEFTNTNYSVQVMQKGGINADAFNGFGIVNMTTASMGVWLYSGVRDGFFWKAEGYIS